MASASTSQGARRRQRAGDDRGERAAAARIHLKLRPRAERLPAMSDLAGQRSQSAVITDRFPNARAKQAPQEPPGTARYPTTVAQPANATNAKFPVLVALIESGHRTYSRPGGSARVRRDLDLSRKVPRSAGGHVAGRPRTLPGAWGCGTGQRDKWVDDMFDGLRISLYLSSFGRSLACQDCGPGGLTWPAAGERTLGCTPTVFRVVPAAPATCLLPGRRLYHPVRE